MKYGLDFIKVHAGWDEIIFVYGDQLPKGKEVDLSLSLLRKPSIMGIEVGILSPPEKNGDIRVRIVDNTKKDFIGMCGGLTQCLGKALVETEIAKKLGVRLTDGINRIELETDIGPIPIEIDIKNGKFQRVMTDMRSYVEDCYYRGVELLEIDGIKMVNVGVNRNEKEYLVLDLAELEKKYDDINFWKKDKSVLTILEEVYRAFLDHYRIPLEFLYGIIYSREGSTGRKSVIRTVFRFYPWDYIPGDDLEFACGTGAIAIGIAMHESRQLSFSEKPENLLLKVGGEHLQQWMRVTTDLIIQGTEEKVMSAMFSHDLVEIIAKGRVYTTLHPV